MRNDHAPKNDDADFFNNFPKKSVLGKKKKGGEIFLTILLSSSSLPQTHFH